MEPMQGSFLASVPFVAFIPGFLVARARFRACDEGSDDAYHSDTNEQHNMRGLWVHRWMRAACQHVIHAWNGIVDADDNGNNRDDDRSKENAWIFQGLSLLFLFASNHLIRGKRVFTLSPDSVPASLQRATALGTSASSEDAAYYIRSASSMKGGMGGYSPQTPTSESP